jgi:hypothetical protein
MARTNLPLHPHSRKVLPVSPEVWALVTREMHTIRQLSRNWLDAEKAEKIARHVETLRQLIRESTGGPEDKRRVRLWWRDPACIWCGRVTRLDRGAGYSNAATVDHLQRRGLRDKINTRRHLPATVLACYRCNHDRGQPPPPPNPMCPLLRVRAA